MYDLLYLCFLELSVCNPSHCGNQKYSYFWSHCFIKTLLSFTKYSFVPNCRVGEGDGGRGGELQIWGKNSQVHLIIIRQ